MAQATAPAVAQGTDIIDPNAPVRLGVKPIDFSKKGSYKQRKTILTAIAGVTFAREQKMSVSDVFAAQMRLNLLVEQHLVTSDGSPVEDALDDISGDDFDDLLWVLLGGGSDSVPPESTSS